MIYSPFESKVAIDERVATEDVCSLVRVDSKRSSVRSSDFDKGCIVQEAINEKVSDRGLHLVYTTVESARSQCQ